MKQNNFNQIKSWDDFKKLIIDNENLDNLARYMDFNTLQAAIESINNMEETQNKLANRVESQEGLMEKVLRQIDHLRSILYERTNFLDEKIEKAYEYFNKIYSKS